MIPGEDDEEDKQAGGEDPNPESFIDQVNAQPAPANASNGKMPDEWPPAVPSEAPGMVPQAPPVGTPAQTPQAPAAPPPVNVPQAMAQTYGDQQQLSDDDVAARKQLGDAKAKASGAEADALDADADRRDDYVDQQAAITQAANQRTQQWADRAQAESEKYMKMDLHDYWADKSTGSKVLGGLAMIIGAVGRTDNSGNAGMNMINAAIERDFRMQQARIEKQKGNVSAARDQYQMGLSEKDQALSDAKLKEAAATDAAAAKLAALRVRQGVPVEQAQTDADVVALKQKAQQLRLGTLKDVHAINLEDAKLQIEKQKEADERLKAEAYARKMGRVGAGGAGGGKAYDAFRAAVLAGSPNVGELAAKAGIKPAQISDQLDKIRTESDKELEAHNKATKGASVDDSRMVRNVDGGEAGLAPTSRAVPQIQRELRTIPRAIEQLKELRNTNWVSTRDPRFHNAVLAVASTTSAGSTDANVTHEKGTLTNALGLPDNDAIDRKIAELENQLTGTQAQLDPLPEGYIPAAQRKPSAKPAAAGGAPSSAPSSAAPAPSRQARAQAIVGDPSKRSLYTEQQWAKLIQASRGN